MLLSPEKEANKMASLKSVGGPRGLHAQFLKQFGPFLLNKYKPKAIVVFSAHWETRGTIEGTSLSVLRNFVCITLLTFLLITRII